jgi:hypothetical protein
LYLSFFNLFYFRKRRLRKLGERRAIPAAPAGLTGADGSGTRVTLFNRRVRFGRIAGPAAAEGTPFAAETFFPTNQFITGFLAPRAAVFFAVILE